VSGLRLSVEMTDLEGNGDRVTAAIWEKLSSQALRGVGIAAVK
jgi:hypothetical protein